MSRAAAPLRYKQAPKDALNAVRMFVKPDQTAFLCCHFYCFSSSKYWCLLFISTCLLNNTAWLTTFDVRSLIVKNVANAFMRGLIVSFKNMTITLFKTVFYIQIQVVTKLRTNLCDLQSIATTLHYVIYI